MKPIIIYIRSYFLFRYTGTTMFFPFVIVSRKSKDINKTLRHELIHFQQMKELWVIGFYVLYLYYWIKYGYRNSPLEREAYANSRDPYYLDDKPKFNYRNYET